MSKTYLCHPGVRDCGIQLTQFWPPKFVRRMDAARPLAFTLIQTPRRSYALQFQVPGSSRIAPTQFPPPCWPIVTLSLSDPLPSTRTAVDWLRMLELFPFATPAHGCVPNTLSIESNWTRGVRCQRRALPPASLADKTRSEEHTSELQSLAYLVCRLLLEKK